MRAIALPLAALATLAVAAAAAPAGACKPDAKDVRQWAFAKLSPVPIFKEAGERAPSGAIATTYATSYPVIGKKGRREIQVCISGRAVWSRRSDFAVTHERLWIRTARTMEQTDRPRLEFWESPDRLRIYVGGKTELAPPDYRELAGNPVKLPVAFPVIRVDFVKMKGGRRDVEVANVLVPFSREAVEAYATIRAAAFAKKPAATATNVLGLVVDISGSTQGLVAKPIRDLVAELQKRPDLAGMRLVAAGFGGDGRTMTLKDLAVDDPKLTSWPSWPARDARSIRQDVNAAIDFVRKNGGEKAPLVVLAGGDVGLSRTSLSGFRSVTVGKLTPEIETELKSSVEGDAATFIDFGPGLGKKVAQSLATAITETRPAPKETLRTDESAFKVVGALMTSAGMLPILPHDIEASERLAVPPAGRTDPAWFAVELFLVVRSDLLEYREE